MEKLELTINEDVKVLKLPTSVDEIDSDYVKELAKGIKIAENYTLVGVVSFFKLNELILSVKRANERSQTTPVVPIFIKAGDCNNYFVSNIQFKDKLVISDTNLKIADTAKFAKNKYSFIHVCNLINKDVTIGKKAVEHAGATICCLDFKVVPNCNIVANYTK